MRSKLGVELLEPGNETMAEKKEQKNSLYSISKKSRCEDQQNLKVVDKTRQIHPGGF